jgi:two-component system sensor histidine kinase KdpD
MRGLHCDRVRAIGGVGRGRLRIFFGAAPRVGKTYSMLEAGRAAHAGGIDLVIGHVETHGSVETQRLLQGLVCLPSLETHDRGLHCAEFDLDAAFERHPAILVVDNLAHTHVQGDCRRQRNQTRWQDVDELLAAGITVWTTVDVGHLEGSAGFVAKITGFPQRDSVPDRFFDEADDIDLIDISLQDLRARLAHERVGRSTPEPGDAATEWGDEMLLALRELSLRRMADRLNADARSSRQPQPIATPSSPRNRLLVAVAVDEQAEALLRAGKHLADALAAEWSVAYVETPFTIQHGEAALNRRAHIFRFAESLGARTVTLDGRSVAEALAEYARLQNITRIVIGKPSSTGIGNFFPFSTASRLMRAGSGFDVSVIECPSSRAGESPGSAAIAPQKPVWGNYLAAFGISLACTSLAAVMYPYFELTNLIMVYLLGATITALKTGRGPASAAAVVNVLAFDFFFVPPRYSFAVTDLQYVVTFGVMLAVALVIATLVASVRTQTQVAVTRERRTALLYAMSEELVSTRSIDELAEVAVKHLAETFASRTVVLFPDGNGRLRYPTGSPGGDSLRGADLSIAQWVYDHGEPAGLGTDTLQSADESYLPLRGSQRALAVLVVQPLHRRRLFMPEQRQLLETFAAQIALTLERARLQEEAQRSRISAETEGMRNTLLASISHDLRTPLAVIEGASSALSDPAMHFNEEARRSLLARIASKSREMTTIVSNVLDLMRLQSGQLSLRLDWVTIDDLVNSALLRQATQLIEHPIELRFATELAPVRVDGSLLLQVFVNLLENVVKYTPAGTPVIISGVPEGPFLRITFDDAGPGLPPGDPERVFAKFHRGNEEGSTGGAGLGLSICRAIIAAHGGEITACQRPGGGARFSFTLPMPESMPVGKYLETGEDWCESLPGEVATGR